MVGIRAGMRTLIALIVAVAALGGALSPTMQSAAQGEDANALLQESAAAMTALNSFHFELSTVQGRSLILDNLELGGVTGDVVRPDKFQATVTAKVAIVEVKVDIVVLDGRVWVTDPLSGGKNWIEVTGGAGTDPADTQALVDLVNPDRLLLTAVSFIKEAKIDGTEDLDGQEVTRVTGVIDTGGLADLAGGTPEAGSSGPGIVTGDMPVTIWIDADKRIVSMEMEGPLTTAESGDVIRRLDLYDFDKPVEIVEPEAAEQ